MRKIIKIFLITAICFIQIGEIAFSGSLFNVCDELHDKISSSLPTGWKCAKNYYGLEIYREKIVLASSMANNYEEVEAPTSIIIRIEPENKMPVEEHRKLECKNNKIFDRINNQESKMQSFSSKVAFAPATEEDKVLYRQYKELLLEYHASPDGYDSKYSYMFFLNFNETMDDLLFDLQVVEEIKNVLNQIFKYIIPYDNDKNKFINDMFQGTREKDLYRYKLDYAKYCRYL